MPVQGDTLHRGIHTRRDLTLIPPGAMSAAANTMYVANDPAIYQATQRAEITGGDANHIRSSEVIDNIVFVEWDTGTTVDGAAETELQQLIYYGYNAAQGALEIGSIELKNDPTDTDMAQVEVRSWASAISTAGLTPGTGTTRWEVVHYNGEHIILSGGDNMVFYRDANGQSVKAHGLPSQDSSLWFQLSTATSSGSTKAGVYTAWFTWYDSTNDIESTASTPAFGTDNGSATFTQGFCEIDTDIATADNLNIVIEQSVLDAAPAGVDQIKLYVAQPQPLPASGTNRINIWPSGNVVQTLTIASLNTDTYTLDGVPTVCYRIRHEDDGGDDGLPIAEGVISTYQTDITLFDYVQVAVGGLAAFSGRKGQPPDATTGDVFDDSLCLNDVTDPRKLKFSWPGLPHEFPATYYINFDTEKLDTITCIKSLGNKLGVFMSGQLWRVNWLPAQTDFDFARGRVRELVSADIGALNPQAVTHVDIPGVGPMLAFVDRNGIYMTDLVTVVQLTEHVNWGGLAGGAANSNVVLINNPDLKRLELYVPTYGWVYYLHYDHTHLIQPEEGGFQVAITGQNTRSAGITTAVAARKPNGSHVTVSTNASNASSTQLGMAYEGDSYEDELMDTPTTPTSAITTRGFQLAGPMNEASVQRYAMHFQNLSGNGTWTPVLNARSGTTALSDTGNAESVSARRLDITLVNGNLIGEEHYLVITSSASQVGSAINWIALEFEDMGRSQPTS